MKNKSWPVFLIPIVIFLFFGLNDLDLPGLYMDSVNPDYIASWMLKKSLSIPAWIYPDNWFAGIYEFPLLNSLYGGNSTAYLAVIFFKIFGFGVSQVHLFHAFLGVCLLLSMTWCLLQWNVPKFPVILFACVLASDPSYIFAWRTQYYLQLYPLIWIFLGIGLVGCVRLNDKKDFFGLKILLAGIFMGFSIYSYFIFSIYVGLFAILFFFETRKEEYKPFFQLIFGVLLGFSPYLYAHVSIILNTDFTSYIAQIKSLQTSYGVVDTSQGGVVDRISTVWERLGQLIFGRGVEATIFGTAEAAIFPAVFAGFFLFFFVAFYRHIFLFFKNYSNINSNLKQHFNLSLLGKFSFLSIFLHLMFGVLVGKPLGIQHYIMLLPLLFFACTIIFSSLLYTNEINSVKNKLKVFYLVFVGFFLIINISTGYNISKRLALEGGNGLYSDAINTTGLYISSLPPETVILFPQWGYWMGVVTITGPKHSIFHFQNIEEMEGRLRSDPALVNKNSFVLVLGEDYFRKSADLDINIDELVRRNSINVKEIVIINGRNNVDQIKLIHLSR